MSLPSTRSWIAHHLHSTLRPGRRNRSARHSRVGNPPAIAPIEGDAVVQKRHPDAFQDTSLQRELESREIKRLIITGIQTEYCIDTTCRRAYSLNYDVILVKDAHSTWGTDLLTAPQIISHHNEVLAGWFAKLKEAREIEFGTAA